MRFPPANFNKNTNEKEKSYNFFDKSTKAINGTVDGKSTGKSLVDMVKNEKTSGFGFNIDEKINRILHKTKEK